MTAQTNTVVREMNSYAMGIPFSMEDVTPSNTVDLTNPGILRIGAAGTVKFITVGGSIGTITAVLGEWFPVKVSRVFAAGTSATGIQVYY